MENGDYRMRINREVNQNMYLRHNIKSFLRGKYLEWVRHVWRSNGMIKEEMTGTTNGKIPSGRPSQR